MNLFRLFRRTILRNVRREKFLTLLSILGIALGVGLFMGVKVATDRAVTAFEANIQGIDAYVNYEIVDRSGIDFNEAVYGTVRRAVSHTFPMVKAHAVLPELSETLEINGVDLVRVVGLLDLPVADPAAREQIFSTENGVLITQRFAVKHGLAPGDRLEALVYSGKYVLKIAGIVEVPTIPIHMALMDIGEYQEFFGKIGELTKLDLKTDDATARELEGVLPPNLRIVKKAKVMENQQSFIASFRYNLQFVSLIAVLVGIFLLYNTIFITVVKGRRDIGILRAVGAGKTTVVLLYTGQGVLLGLIGSLIGVVLGQVFAYFSVAAVEKTVSTIFRTISISDYLITGQDGMMAVLLGVAVSFVASLLPAFESARVRPNASVREGAMEKQYRPHYRALFAAGAACVFFGAWIAYRGYRSTASDFPYLAYGGILVFIFGCTLCAPYYLYLFLKILDRPVKGWAAVTGRIAINDMQGSLYRFSIALMSVAISTSLIVALLSSIHSMKRSLQDWINTYMIADVYIKPASCTSNYCFHAIPKELAEQIAAMAEVESVGRFRALELDYQGKKIVAGFGSTEVWAKHGDPDYLDQTEKSRLSQLDVKREVSISDYLGIKYNLQTGETMELETPQGPKTFTVRNRAISYSTTSGFIYLDRRWLQEFWGLDDETQLTVFVRQGQDVDGFVRKLKADLLNRYSLEIVNNEELRREIVTIFNRSFAVTYAIELIAIVVSLIGVINTLLILVFERKREISVLRYLGGSWNQITGTIVISAGLVGLAGIGLGVLMGPFISMVIIHVVNKISFGWEVGFSAPYGLLGVLTLILFLTTLLAGFLPARIARKVDPKAFVSFE